MNISPKKKNSAISQMGTALSINDTPQPSNNQSSIMKIFEQKKNNNKKRA